MLLLRSFKVEYTIKKSNPEPQKDGRFIKQSRREKVNKTQSYRYFDAVCDESKIEEEQRRQIDEWIKSISDSNTKVIVDDIKITNEYYVKDIPMQKCLELLTPAQFFGEFGYLFLENVGGLI